MLTTRVLGHAIFGAIGLATGGLYMALSPQPLRFVAGQLLFYSLVGLLALVIPTQVARRRVGIRRYVRSYAAMEHELDKVIHKAPEGRLVLLLEHVAFLLYCVMLSGLFGMILGN